MGGPCCLICTWSATAHDRHLLLHRVLSTSALQPACPVATKAAQSFLLFLANLPPSLHLLPSTIVQGCMFVRHLAELAVSFICNAHCVFGNASAAEEGGGGGGDKECVGSAESENSPDAKQQCGSCSRGA